MQRDLVDWVMARRDRFEQLDAPLFVEHDILD